MTRKLFFLFYISTHSLSLEYVVGLSHLYCYCTPQKRTINLLKACLRFGPVIDCKYIDINSFNTIKFQQKSFNILHLNIASLGAHKEELEAVLSSLDHDFDVIGLSETKIKKT